MFRTYKAHNNALLCMSIFYIIP